MFVESACCQAAPRRSAMSRTVKNIARTLGRLSSRCVQTTNIRPRRGQERSSNVTCLQAVSSAPVHPLNGS